MRLMKFGLAALAAVAFDANAQSAIVGMGQQAGDAPTGIYQTKLNIENGSASDNFAFHAGGVASCDGCHVMHNAQNGVRKSTNSRSPGVTPWKNSTNAYLLQGSDQSSTCLICHGGEKTLGLQFTVFDPTTATQATNRTPGGDFGWLRSDFDWTNSPAAAHGHNIAAADFSLNAEGRPAPGGVWAGPTQGRKAFACSSCHDPHGRYRMQVATDTTVNPNGIMFAGPYASSPATQPIAASGSYGAVPTTDYAVGAYRLLAGQLYTPASNDSAPFVSDPPVAVAPATYNQSEAQNEVRVAYGTGMSEWCSNCHPKIHMDRYESGYAGLKHPAGSDAKFRGPQIYAYNTYVSSGIVNKTASANYTSLVPFEQGKDATLAQLKTNASPDSIVAADAKSNVMCLSCHRAHASGFDSMVRWDQNATFLTDGAAYTNGVADGRSATTTQAAYYDRDASKLGKYQRSLCNKCHVKD